MGRQFLVGAAVTMVFMIFGLRMEARMPDQAGPGEEIVEFHGLRVYEAKIPSAVEHSPIRALAVVYGVIAAGMIVGGAGAVLLGRLGKRAESEPRAD